MNNRGQSLVLFVILIPILIGMLALSYDASLCYYEENKIENIVMMVSKYYFNDNEDYKSLIDSNLDNVNINESDDYIELNVTKNIDGVFSRMFNINVFRINRSYRLMKIDKKIIKGDFYE